LLEIATKLHKLNTLILALLVSLVAHAAVLFAVSHNIRTRIVTSPQLSGDRTLITARIIQQIGQGDESKDKYQQSVAKPPIAVEDKSQKNQSHLNNHGQVDTSTVPTISYVDASPRKTNSNASILVKAAEQPGDSISSTRYFGSEEVDSPARPMGEISIKSYFKNSELNQAGIAIVRIWVSDDGIVEAVEVISSSSPDFGKLAAKMIEATRFSPAVRDGVTVAAEIQFEIAIID
jgi:TonB family protein